MILLPAVDIRDGKAVRLRQGRFDDETVYADDPLEAARSFVEAGANFLHVVDLDGAREGEPVNLHHVERIASELDVAVELGGGLRSIASIRRALGGGRDAGRARHRRAHRPRPAGRGAERVHVADPGRGRRPRRTGVRVGLDAGDADARRRGDQAAPGPGRHAVRYTNVDRDGMLEGPDLDEVRRISEAVRGRFLYSGGIGSVEDLRALRSLRLVNLAGVISGKALYEGRFSVREGQEALA